MKIISVWNEKGGVGKTTLSLNVAAGLAQHGKVMLVDLDPQGSSEYLHKKGNLPFLLSAGYPTSDPGVDFLVVDHPPGVAEPPHKKANIVLVPVISDVFSFHAFRHTVKKLENHAGKIVPVLNQYDSRSEANRQAREWLQERFDPVMIVRKRSGMSNTLNSFQTVYTVGKIRRALSTSMRDSKNDLDDIIDLIIE